MSKHEGILRKVYEAMYVVSIDQSLAKAAVKEMQNRGVIFRERHEEDIMTNHRELIAEARSYPPVAEWDELGEADALIRRLTDALEASTDREIRRQER